MKFFINSVSDSGIAPNEPVLPVLRMVLVNDGRYDFHKFHEMIQNSNITFSMQNIENGIYKIANSPAFIKRIPDECCVEEYEVCYQFKKREVSQKGAFKGYFTIKFGNDLKNDKYEYPKGVLIVPIREELEIIIK